MAQLAAGPGTVKLGHEISEAMSRSNSTAVACATDLIHASLVHLRNANDGLARAIAARTAEVARVTLGAVVGWG